MISHMARRYWLAGWVIMALAILLFLALSEAASACPTCKAGLASHDPAHGDLVGAYMWSILFLMAMPFTLLGSFSAYMYWQVRQARAQQAAQASPAASRAVGPSTAELAPEQTGELLSV